MVCPCCEGQFRAFLVRGKNRKEFQCPGCGSLERHRLFKLYLNEQTDVFSGDTRTLHIAPESYLHRWFKQSRGRLYVCGDLSLKQYVNIQLDICNLPFADKSFEFILCSHVLEHVTDDRAAMREFLRVLRPGGLALLQAPIDPRRDKTLEHSTVESTQERKRLAGAHGHRRTYGLDYKSRLENAGLAVRVVDYEAKLSRKDAELFGIVRRLGEELFICTRASLD